MTNSAVYKTLLYYREKSKVHGILCIFLKLSLAVKLWREWLSVVRLTFPSLEGLVHKLKKTITQL